VGGEEGSNNYRSGGGDNGYWCATMVISDGRSGGSYQWKWGMLVVTMTITILTSRGGGGDAVEILDSSSNANDNSNYWVVVPWQQGWGGDDIDGW